ncbi:hypothetical protein PHYPSEUDO_004245 [Phytophthora pseudosyringae]|uniref:Crinkler (CRN) family protein n=1 Tax=Phytophthora pseudosyringae TaxID=221518 RepID=A0A8T1VSF7_9STRA|nr:hypothetical protein PHYPSEUDO_004245 [Phytophthora pseudosyringae]
MDSADRLLRMGVVTEVLLVTAQYSLAIISPMMKRVCLEALPAREIHKAVAAEDPVQLLSVALAYVNPNTIAHLLVKNRNSPSEAVFYFELYAVLRDILDKAGTKKIYPEVKTADTKTRADILITNGDRLAYELKVNQLLEKSEINVAAAQADGDKNQFGVQRMLVVNFVPAGHTFDNVYRVETCPTVEIVHVEFSASYDDFRVFCLREEDIPQGEKKKYFGNLQSQFLEKIKCIEVHCLTRLSGNALSHRK